MTDKLILWGIILATATGLSYALYKSVQHGAKLDAELQYSQQTIESQRAQMAVNRAKAQQDRDADAAAINEMIAQREEQKQYANQLESDLEAAKNENADLESCFNMRLPDSIRLP